MQHKQVTDPRVLVVVMGLEIDLGHLSREASVDDESTASAIGLLGDHLK